MKKSIFIVLSVIMFSACGNTEYSSVKTEKKTTALPVAQEDSQDAAQADIPPKVSKKELQKIVFESGFEDSEYYNRMKEIALNIQLDIAQQKAQETSNEKECEKISDTNMQNKCLSHSLKQIAIINSDVTKCDPLPKEEKNKCADQVLYNLSMSKEDREVCAKINDEEIRNRCKNQITHRTALRRKDETLCEEIPDEKVKERCVSEVVQEKKIDQQRAERQKQMEEDVKREREKREARNQRKNPEQEIIPEQPEKGEQNPSLEEGTSETSQETSITEETQPEETNPVIDEAAEDTLENEEVLGEQAPPPEGE